MLASVQVQVRRLYVRHWALACVLWMYKCDSDIDHCQAKKFDSHLHHHHRHPHAQNASGGDRTTSSIGSPSVLVLRTPYRACKGTSMLNMSSSS